MFKALLLFLSISFSLEITDNLFANPQSVNPETVKRLPVMDLKGHANAPLASSL